MSGLTFKGIHSSQFDIILKSDNRQALSDVTRITKQIPGYHGTIDFGIDTYGEKQLTVTLQYDYKGSMTTLLENAEQISGWLYDDGNYYDLIFDDRPNRKYKAKMAAKMDVTAPPGFAAIQVSFTCNPPHAFALDNTPVSPADIQQRLLWDTASLNGIQYLQEFSTSGDMRFTVGGTQPVKPVIKLIGKIPAGFSLTYIGTLWRYTEDLLYDGIQIDCSVETVKRMSDGVSLYNKVDPVKRSYFVLQPGQQKISVSGNMSAWPNSVNIAVEFTPIMGG